MPDQCCAVLAVLCSAAQEVAEALGLSVAADPRAAPYS